MLKRIPKSDISVRPFKAYKEWSFDQSSTEVSLLEANISSSDLSGLYPKNSIYGQLRAQFYNGLEDNPFLRFGEKSNEYDINPSSRDRFLGDDAKIISIPQIYIGEGIKKGSISYADSGKVFIDDGYGNLINSAGSSVTFAQLDLQNNNWEFVDILSTIYNGSFQLGINLNDIQNGILSVIYNGHNYTLKVSSFDIQSGVLVVENIPFLELGAGVDKIGNVFYTQGLIVMTRNTENLLNGR